MGIDCGGAADEDYQPWVTDKIRHCVMWEPRVGAVQLCVQQISPFFMFGSAFETERDILSCASLTRAQHLKTWLG